MVSYTPEFIRESSAKANAEIMDFFQREIPQALAPYQNDPELSKIFNISQTTEAHIENGFMGKIQGLFTSDEQAFILDTAAKFDRVKLGFAYFSLLSSNERPFAALRLTKLQKRTGWAKTGIHIDLIQTVHDHLLSTEMLAKILFRDDPDLPLIRRICRHHDIGESVIGDFTPHCPISRPDKAHIELLGIRLITSARTRGIHPLAKTIYDSVTLYDGDAPEYEGIRSKIRDCDLLEMAIEATSLIVKCPNSQRKDLVEKLQEFWDYIGPRLTTPVAKKFFEGLEPIRYTTEPQRDFFRTSIRSAASLLYVSPTP